MADRHGNDGSDRLWCERESCEKPQRDRRSLCRSLCALDDLDLWIAADRLFRKCGSIGNTNRQPAVHPYPVWVLSECHGMGRGVVAQRGSARLVAISRLIEKRKGKCSCLRSSPSSPQCLRLPSLSSLSSPRPSRIHSASKGRSR